jgi:proteasome accessory factor A
LRGDHERLVGRVDWASKYWLLNNFREAEQLDWHDRWIKSLDLAYHNLETSKGLYFALADEGRVSRYITDDAAALAADNPPRNTRAFGRGEAIRRMMAGDARYVITWAGLMVEGKPPLRMPDPFKTYTDAVAEQFGAAAPREE